QLAPLSRLLEEWHRLARYDLPKVGREMARRRSRLERAARTGRLERPSRAQRGGVRAIAAAGGALMASLEDALGMLARLRELRDQVAAAGLPPELDPAVRGEV